MAGPKAILTKLICLVAVAGLVGITYLPSKAGAESPNGQCPLSCPDPPSPPGPPDGGPGRFSGTALFTRDGEVISSGDDSTSCAGCTWEVIPLCTPSNPHDCHEHRRYCTRVNPGSLPHEIWLIRPAGSRDFVRYLCIGDPDDLLTVDDVATAVSQKWLVLVPEQDPSVQPPGGRTLVNLPTIFDSGQPARMDSETVRVFNFDVTVAAVGEWTWHFAPGATETFTQPGSQYPDTTVSFIYRTADSYDVTLDTEWKGQFFVGDHGPYDIAHPATQGPYHLPIEVVENRSLLGA